MKSFREIFNRDAQGKLFEKEPTGLGGYKMKKIKSAIDNDVNITYELWKGEEKAGTRVVDNDAGETVDLRLYPIKDFKKAEKAYNGAVKTIGK